MIDGKSRKEKEGEKKEKKDEEEETGTYKMTFAKRRQAREAKKEAKSLKGCPVNAQIV